MKKQYKIFVLATALAAFLSSCGTQIQMTEAIPAKVNLGRGTTMNITCFNPLDKCVAAEIRKKIVADGFYMIPEQGITRGNAYMKISTDVEKERITGSSLLAAKIDISNGSQVVYHKEYLSTITESGGVDSAAATIARTVMRDITPYEKNLYVRVKGSKKVPEVASGALACKAGNWEQGEAYAREALQKAPNDPEALFLMGVIERHKMNYTQSSLYFSKANAIKPSGKYKAAISKNKVMSINDQHVSQQLSN